MKKLDSNIRNSILISLLFLCCILLSTGVVKGQTTDYNKQYEDALAYEKEYAKEGALSDWTVFTLARAGALTKQQKQDYLAGLKQLLEEKQGILSRSHSTEYSRTALAVTALGIDANNVYGYSLLEPLCCYDFTVQQGIYGGIYALLAFDSGNYELPDTIKGYQKTTRENLISYILGRQLSDGGWAVSGRYADADTTAIVISALTPYYEKQPKVKCALDKGLERLSAMMGKQGCYASYGTFNAESTAQVLVTMAVFGISLDNSSFVQEDSTILDGLFTFQLADGSFEHQKGQGYSQMATEQALYALVALKRKQENKTSLYTMTEVNPDDSAERPKKTLQLADIWGELETPEPSKGDKEQTVPDEKEQLKEEKEQGNVKDEQQVQTNGNPSAGLKMELVKELPSSELGLNPPRADKGSKRNRARSKNEGSNQSRKNRVTVRLNIKPNRQCAVPKSKAYFANQTRHNKSVKKRKDNRKPGTALLFPSAKQTEIALLIEDGISFTVERKGFHSPFLLEHKVELGDGDYVLCRYVDEDTKPEALAKVWVKDGVLTAAMKEPGHYFVAKRVHNCSVSELRLKQTGSNSLAQQEKRLKTPEKGVGEKNPGNTTRGSVKRQAEIIILLIIGIGIGIGWKLICSHGKKL